MRGKGKGGAEGGGGAEPPPTRSTQRRRGAEAQRGDHGRVGRGPTEVTTENEITGRVVDAAIEVHRLLGGPGLLESVYEEALICELQLRGMRVERQRPVGLLYKGHRLASDLRLDLLVEGKVIVECKATAEHHPVFEAQALTYLRLPGLKVALVINFGLPLVKDGIHRIVNKA